MAPRFRHLGFAYQYDANKNPTAETTGGVFAGYSWSTPGAAPGGYDNESRLTSWLRSNGNSQLWSLSLVGDWNQTTINSGGGGPPENRTHPPVHAIDTINTQPVAHDLKGNMTKDRVGLTNPRYQYDYDNQLGSTDINDDSQPDIYYTYDALRRRVSKTFVVANSGAGGTKPPRCCRGIFGGCKAHGWHPWAWVPSVP